MIQKNVLYVIPSMDSGGVEVGMLEFVKKNYEKKGVNIFLLSSGGPMISKVKYYGAQCVILNVKSKNPIVIFRNINKIKKIIIDKKIDIVQVESRAPAWSCFYACRALGVPLITVVQSAGLLRESFFLKKIYNSMMFRGNPIIAVSNFVKTSSVGIYKNVICEKKLRRTIEVVSRGIDPSVYSQENVSQSRKLILQEELKLPDDKIIITLPARFTVQKGQEYFLNVLRHLRMRNYLCLMVGDVEKNPKFVNRIKKLIYDYNLQNYVKIHSNVNDMPALYSLSGVVISSSIQPESFGRVSIESQSMGKLFVGTALGGTLETVIDGLTGFLVPEDNAKEFAKILDRVVNLSDQEKAEISKKSRENVIENFSFDAMYSRMLDLYREIDKYENFGCWD